MAREELFFIAFIAVAALGLYNLQDSQQKLAQPGFQLWENRHGKSYSPMQRQYRFSVWSQNLLYVQTHNELFKKGLVSYDLEMNMFADLTLQEFSSIYLIDYSGHSVTGKCTGSQASIANLPDEIDWSAKGAVTGVKNQGQCGSCWAFSSTGSLEGALYRSNGTLASFSEQNLVDCSQSYGNNGCGGGWMNSSFFYVIDNGIALESKYPYHGVQGKCSYNPATDKAWRISNCVEVTVEKELSLQASVALNPVSVAIEANHASFQLYKSGVYTGNCGVKLDHGVLAVGYGTLSGKKYWKVKNSWGATWGDKGYIFIENTGDGKGKCGIQMAASYPLP